MPRSPTLLHRALAVILHDLIAAQSARMRRDGNPEWTDHASFAHGEWNLVFECGVSEEVLGLVLLPEDFGDPNYEGWEEDRAWFDATRGARERFREIAEGLRPQIEALWSEGLLDGIEMPLTGIEEAPGLSSCERLELLACVETLRAAA